MTGAGLSPLQPGGEGSAQSGHTLNSPGAYLRSGGSFPRLERLRAGSACAGSERQTSLCLPPGGARPERLRQHRLLCLSLRRLLDHRSGCSGLKGTITRNL